MPEKLEWSLLRRGFKFLFGNDTFPSLIFLVFVLLVIVLFEFRWELRFELCVAVFSRRSTAPFLVLLSSEYYLQIFFGEIVFFCRLLF